ncbi:MAG: hypothetical protein WCT18_02210, partial [Patescibacteria group bacterium]
MNENSIGEMAKLFRDGLVTYEQFLECVRASNSAMPNQEKILNPQQIPAPQQVAGDDSVGNVDGGFYPESISTDDMRFAKKVWFSWDQKEKQTIREILDAQRSKDPDSRK